MGAACPVKVYSDRSSASAFTQRRGLSRLRHVQTRFLWIQERIAMKHLKVFGAKGTDNPADVSTKSLVAKLSLDVDCSLVQHYQQELSARFSHLERAIQRPRVSSTSCTIQL